MSDFVIYFVQNDSGLIFVIVVLLNVQLVNFVVLSVQLVFDLLLNFFVCFGSVNDDEDLLVFDSVFGICVIIGLFCCLGSLVGCCGIYDEYYLMLGDDICNDYEGLVIDVDLVCCWLWIGDVYQLIG